MTTMVVTPNLSDPVTVLELTVNATVMVGLRNQELYAVRQAPEWRLLNDAEVGTLRVHPRHQEWCQGIMPCTFHEGCRPRPFGVPDSHPILMAASLVKAGDLYLDTEARS